MPRKPKGGFARPRAAPAHCQFLTAPENSARRKHLRAWPDPLGTARVPATRSFEPPQVQWACSRPLFAHHRAMPALCAIARLSPAASDRSEPVRRVHLQPRPLSWRESKKCRKLEMSPLPRHPSLLGPAPDLPCRPKTFRLGRNRGRGPSRRTGDKTACSTNDRPLPPPLATPKRVPAHRPPLD